MAGATVAARPPPPYWPGWRSRPRHEPWDAAARRPGATTNDSSTRRLRARGEPRLVPIPDELDRRSRRRSADAGIDQLYAHQADALYSAFERPTIDHDRHGLGQVAVLPAADARGADRRPHAPARSTSTRPRRWRRTRPARCTASDCTSRSARRSTTATRRAHERAAIRKRSNLVLTNPDMLHVGILPHHPAWGDLLANLAFVVVDEAHVYRGVFGSHVANVLRRLRRAAAIHGTEPRFLLASATIANPLELAERLTGLTTSTLVDHDAAPQADPPRRDVEPAARSTRSSASAAPRCTRRPSCSPSCRRRRADDLLHEVAQGRRADPAPRPRPARAGARRADRALPRRLHARSSARTSSAG